MKALLYGRQRAFCSLLLVQLTLFILLLTAFHILHKHDAPATCRRYDHHHHHHSTNNTTLPPATLTPSNHQCYMLLARSDKHDPRDYFTPRESSFHGGQDATPFLIQPHQDICGSRLDMLVLVVSSPDHADTREAIRNTWGSMAYGKHWPGAHFQRQVAVVFVVGRPLTDVVKTEARDHGDVLILDHDDTYRNLTHKVLAALRWASLRCSEAKFVVKIDEDMYMNVDLTLTVLDQWTRNAYSVAGTGSPANSIFGNIQCPGDSDVFRDEGSDLFVNVSQYPFQYYPSYVSGGHYVLPGSLVPRLVNASAYMPVLPVEDAFITGVLGRVLNVNHVQLPNVVMGAEHLTPSTILTFCYLSAHGMDKGKLRDIWDALHRRPYNCSEVLKPLKTCSQFCWLNDVIIVP